MRRFYAPKENFHDREIILDKEQSRHLRNVLRLRAGDEVRVFDGAGHEYLCLVRDRANLRTIREIEPKAPESDLDLTLAVALLKGDKFDLVIQKAVELGARKLVPLLTKRGEVRFRNPSGKIERWRKIIIEASKQCGRAKLLELSEPCEFEAFVGETPEIKVLFAERGGEPFAEITADKKMTALIGPEGGWDDAELEFAEEKGVRIITLAGRILRAETAAISIAAILQNRFGDLN